MFAEPRVNGISELEDIDSLVARHWNKVLRFVAFSINDADLAQSITQDAFLKAYDARSSFRGDSSVSTWIISIANNLIRDHVRLKKVQFWRKAESSAIDVSEMASVIASNERSPEARILVRERTEQVKAALDQLSVNQRRVFLLKFFEDMNLEEISKSTGMPVNTVKTHLHRAITAIRGKLGGEA